MSDDHLRELRIMRGLNLTATNTHGDGANADAPRCEMCGQIKDDAAAGDTPRHDTADAIRALAEQWAYEPNAVALIFLRILFPGESLRSIARRWNLYPMQATRIRKRLERTRGMKSFFGVTPHRISNAKPRPHATPAT